MSAELVVALVTILVAILGVGIALATLITRGERATRDELGGRIGRLEESLRTTRDELGGRIDRLGEQVDGLDKKVGLLAERQAKLEGLLEGLREAMTGRRVSS